MACRSRWPTRWGTSPRTNVALILDTTLLVATERNRRRLDGMVADDDDVVIAAITAAELLAGVHLADEAHRQGRTAFADKVIDTIPTVDHDLDVARAHAALLAHTRSTGRPRGAHDLIITATARSTTRIVVSADATAFTDLPNVAHRP